MISHTIVQMGDTWREMRVTKKTSSGVCLFNDNMDPTTLLPAAKASGRCPPLLIRDDAIVEGGVFEMALLRSLNMNHGESFKSNDNLMDFVPGTGDGGRLSYAGTFVRSYIVNG